jgi:hypothetical protein
MSSPLSASSSPLSSLSSVPDDEPMPAFMLDGAGDEPSASSSDVEDENTKYQREPSPPHEETLADNPDIAVSRWRVERVSNRVPEA